MLLILCPSGGSSTLLIFEERRGQDLIHGKLGNGIPPWKMIRKWTVSSLISSVSYWLLGGFDIFFSVFLSI